MSDFTTNLREVSDRLGGSPALLEAARYIDALEVALEPFAAKKTIEEALADPSPPVWANATPERRIEMLGENKRKNDADIRRARETLRR